MHREGMITRLRLGRVVATRGVLDAVPKREVLKALERHQNCDWGEVKKTDWASNDSALTRRERIISVYRADNQTKFWIITEADRSATTVMLPEEY